MAKRKEEPDNSPDNSDVVRPTDSPVSHLTAHTEEGDGASPEDAQNTNEKLLLAAGLTDLGMLSIENHPIVQAALDGDFAEQVGDILQSSEQVTIRAAATKLLIELMKRDLESLVAKLYTEVTGSSTLSESDGAIISRMYNAITDFMDGLAGHEISEHLNTFWIKEGDSPIFLNRLTGQINGIIGDTIPERPGYSYGKALEPVRAYIKQHLNQVLNLYVTIRGINYWIEQVHSKLELLQNVDDDFDMNFDWLTSSVNQLMLYWQKWKDIPQTDENQAA